MLRIALLAEGLQHMVASAHDVGVVLGTCWRLHTGVEHGKGSVSRPVPSSIFSLHISACLCLALPHNPSLPFSAPVCRSISFLLPLESWNEMETRKKAKREDNARQLMSRLRSDWQLHSVRCAAISVARSRSTPFITAAWSSASVQCKRVQPADSQR